MVNSRPAIDFDKNFKDIGEITCVLLAMHGMGNYLTVGFKYRFVGFLLHCFQLESASNARLACSRCQYC